MKDVIRTCNGYIFKTNTQYKNIWKVRRVFLQISLEKNFVCLTIYVRPRILSAFFFYYQYNSIILVKKKKDSFFVFQEWDFLLLFFFFSRHCMWVISNATHWLSVSIHGSWFLISLHMYLAHYSYSVGILIIPSLLPL